VIIVLVLLAALAPAAHAQVSGSSSVILSNVYGPYAVYGPGLTYRPPTFYYGAYSTRLSVATSVAVPDGAEALVGGQKLLSEGRNEFGAPLVGRVPYLGRGFRNIGYGRSALSTTVSVRVRVIRLADEEERQTGVRP
jgi:hypothetical protein